MKNSVVKMLILSVLALNAAYAAVDILDVQQTIQKQQDLMWNEVHNSTWYYPPYLGEMFISEYYFQTLVLNWTHKTAFNTTYFTERLLKKQFSDGSWEQVPEQNLPTGQLDATIFNYWYLKTVNNHPDIPAACEKAKAWILAHGGIEGAQTMTKYKLASYGQFPWEDLWYIPLFLFRKDGIYKYTYMKDLTGQWVYPHMAPLAYMRYQRAVFLAPVADLKELWLNYPKNGIHINPRGYHRETPDPDLINLLNEILALRRPLGSIGAYTVSTLLSTMCFQDFTKRHPQLYAAEMQEFETKGYDFVEWNIFNFREAYHGTLDDGRWWDTILISWAMLESGADKDRVLPIVQHMVKEGLQPKTGISYGYDFEYAPDTDDTSLLMVVLSYFKDTFSSQITDSLDWLFSMQNDDGGYGAFDKGKNGNNYLLKIAFDITGIANSSEIFDPSCPDITGHFLEALGEFDYTPNSNHQIKKMIKFLKHKQDHRFGSWEARWGVNYIFSAGAVIPGLARIHYDLNEPWVQEALNYLVSKQNEDGGFGECVLSYNDPVKWNGVGKSTVSQTAWGLLGLLEAYNQSEAISNAADRAVQYLLDQFKRDGNTFFDHSTVGTGHRGLLYLQYPSYAQSFPLVALTRYNKIKNGTFKFSKNLFKQDGELTKQQDK